MKTKLEKKVVLVTGASKGIGAGIAKEMGKAGAQVIVNYATSKKDAEAVVQDIMQAGGNAIAIQGDVSKQSEVQRLFEETIKAFGKVDVVVNNAGSYEFALLENVTEASFKRTFELNVFGILLTSKEALRLFGPDGGSIINISSFAGTRPEPYSVVYAASKGAVDSITYALSQELGPKNIRVNSIRPGGVMTEGVAKLGFEEDSAAFKAIVERSALGRMAKPSDIGAMAAFLASDEAKIITGQTIEVSGGFK